MPKRKAIRYCRNSNGTDLEQVVQTHQTSHRSGWPSGFGELNPSLPSWIFTSVFVDFSPCSYLFTSVARVFSFSSMEAAIINGKREDLGDEVDNREVPESLFVSRCITGTPGSGVRIVVAQQKYYNGLYGGSFKGQE